MWPRMSLLSHQHLLVPQYTKPLLEEKTCYCQRRMCWQYCRSDGYWVEHHDCKKKFIFSYHVCSTLMRICFSSYQEVKSVVLHTLNRARFTVAVDSFLKTGRVPTLRKGNAMENVFNLPWSKHSPIVLGPRFKDAFQDANSYFAIEPVFERERCVVTYNPSKGNIYALFKDQAKPDDIFKAAFHAKVLLHIIRSSNGNMSSRKHHENDHSV